MYNIIPLNIPTVGVVDKLQILVIGFNLFPTSITVYYKLLSESKSIDGNLDLPSEVIAMWGTDDSVVLNYVVGELGVELAPNE